MKAFINVLVKMFAWSMVVVKDILPSQTKELNKTEIKKKEKKIIIKERHTAGSQRNCTQ